MMKITLTNAEKSTLDKRIKDYEKKGYKLLKRGMTFFDGYNPYTKYWAVLELNDS